MLKKTLLGLFAIIVIMQFIRPDKNVSNNETYNIATKYSVSLELNQILKASCIDCHSNKTEYPWYSNIQPVAWWLDHHITDGKRSLNFSEFTKLPIAIQNHKFEETIEMIEEHKMPLASYTYLGLHKGANLTDKQRKIIVNWAKAQMDTLKANYPADSLVMKRKPRGVPPTK